LMGVFDVFDGNVGWSCWDDVGDVLRGRRRM